MPRGVYVRTKEYREKLRRSHLGKKRTEEHKRNMRIALKGLVKSESHRKNLSLALKGNTNARGRILTELHKSRIGKANSGENHGNWKGDKVKYRALHHWVVRRLGKARNCEHCGTVAASRYEWANKSHAYRRDLEDWMQLCLSCHKKYDKYYKELKMTEALKELCK
jgi:hypothetical protein